ncbi:MAG: pectate lyase [Prevotella sp.]|nr:pectate lyase [Prevotella sp.]
MKRTLIAICSLLTCLYGSAQEQQHTEDLPDYSYCGYRMSAEALPDVAVKVFVSHKDGDQSARLQKAIDYVSSMKADKMTGFRGAVLLDKGIYELSKPLRISASGVVIRGVSKTETVLRKTGVDRGAVVYIEGKDDFRAIDTLHITDNYVAVGEKTIHVSEAVQAAKAQDILIVRPSTKEWIESIGCTVFGGNLPYWGWKAGEMDVRWARSCTAVNDNALTLDAPLTTSLDKKWGDAFAVLYEWKGRISGCGVENLTIASDAVRQNAADPSRFTVASQPMDEDHVWDGVYIDNAENCWVRMCNFQGLAGSAVIVHRGAQQVTVEDCISRQPVSEIGGLRRRTFLTMGGKCLFLRCYSEEGINDFSAGYCAPGPNAFVQCDAVGSHGFSGGSSSWATGLLFDNVNIEGGGISFKNLELDKWGAGWNTANSTLYQCSASYIDCYSPAEDAKCYAVGCWAYCQGNGVWKSTNDHVSPYSLYTTQLSARLGTDIRTRFRILERGHDGATSPSVARAAEMAREALLPRITLDQWIDSARLSASVEIKGVKAVDAVKDAKGVKAEEGKYPAITANGTFVLASSSDKDSQPVLMTGKFHRTPWWNGRTRYPYMAKADYAVTRFVPGMEQRGGTDRIDSILVNIRKQGVAVWNQNYGLWYDRRRDDHERIKRQNGDVWAPFFEQSIARSGKGVAWDGLSKYDLTKLNKWYVSRIGQLAEAAPDMLIINQHFFQHNIIEAGAHWVDSPWRSANNIQSEGVMTGEGSRGTNFLEPVPFTGDKRIFTADLFYDVSDAERARLYKQYIWQVLDEFADNPNVYHSISEEFTGPQHFTEFWLDCVGEWQAKTGKDARVILNANKNVTDAVMAKAKYADIVDVVEIEQWFYDSSLKEPTSPDAANADNPKLYAPKGGVNLAPRQHLRLIRTGQPTFQDVYRTVSEMRQAFPSKPVLYYAKAYDRNPWAIVLAGGSCPVLTVKDAALAKALPDMKPVYSSFPYDGIFRMEGKAGSLVYNATEGALPLASLNGGKAKGQAFVVNQKDGTLSPLKSADVPVNTLVWIK